MTWSGATAARGIAGALAARGLELAAGLASLLAPRACVTCRRPLPPHGPARPEAWARALCPGCRGRLGPIDGACLGCGAPRGPHAAPSRRCAACRGVPLGGVARTTALWRYRGVARRLLHAVKYEGREDLCPTLGLALAAHLAARTPTWASTPGLLVVPVPVHRWRRITRGYDQGAVLAAGVAEGLGRPLLAALERRRATPPLHGVDRDARDAVVAGAFRCVAPDAVRGRPVLLVDDIRTSGATLRAAARALRRAGARRIEAGVLAR